jgi:hypothetical protein
MNAVASDSFFTRLGGIYCAAARMIDKLQPASRIATRSQKRGPARLRALDLEEMRWV